jgi:hypothetical protein
MTPHRLLIGSGAWLAAFLFLATALSGCVTAGKVGTDIFHSLTPEQQKEAAVLERAMIRLCQYARTQGSSGCYPPTVLIVWNNSLPHYNAGSNTIYMPGQTLTPDGRYAAAHELGHWYLSHNAQRCSDRAACELEANWAGLVILREGYGYEGDTAWRIMRRYLQTLVESKRPLAPGHPSACVELNDYLRRSAMPPDPCSGQVTR